MDPLGFAATTTQSTRDGYFQQLMITTAYQTNSLEAYLDQLQNFLAQVLTHEVVQRRGLKVFAILHCIYEKPLGEELALSVVPLPIKTFILTHKSQVAGDLQAFASQIKVRNENMLRLQSFLNLSSVSHLELHLAEHNPLVTGSTFVELPTFLAQKYCIVNVQNTDDRCFGYAVLSAVYPIGRDDHPNQPHHYNWRFNWRGLDRKSVV